MTVSLVSRFKSGIICHVVLNCFMIHFSFVEVPSNVLIHSSSGTGTVYSFDPVGSYERETCRAAGAAQSLVQPFLDNQVSSGPYTLILSTCWLSVYISDLYL